MSIKKHILFLFIEILIFLFSVQLFSKTKSIAWDFPVEIKIPSALGFFDKTDINGTSEKEKARDEIKDKLTRAFNLALATYEINKGNINANGIKTALNTLLENIRNGSKKITITFAFDKGTIKEPGYYKYYQKEFGYGKMKFSDMEKNLDVHGGTKDCDKKITIYNGIEDFSWKNYKATKDGCSYETVIRDLDYKKGKTLAPPWQPSSIKTYSIAGAIFHELVHIALNCYGNSNVKTRYKDEATVNEVMLKIFPHGTGFNVYEMSYFLQLMNYQNGREKDKAFKFKEDKISRIFNPPYYGVYKNLIYKEVDKKIKVIKHGVTKITESPVNVTIDDGSNTDDCRDEAMKKYVIPYFICCNGQSQKSYSMRALSSDDDECDPECPEGGKGGGHGPGNDNADDRYSFSEGIVREYNLAPEAVIFTDGYWEDAIKLYGGLKFDGDNAAEQLLESTPFLVIPSGGLFSKEQDSTFKAILEKYVSLGGTIVVFCQQFGSHVENVVPIPEGESLKVYGWRESQSISS